ncbi:MAG: carboxymuconolactone decarboxylase family protein [Gemmatimonadota bacterium]
MSWIRTIPYERAEGSLRALYDRVRGPAGDIDNILLLHGLRPHTLQGHMTLYKNVLHHSGNRLPKWLLEMIGVYVSLLNRCDYCADHHFVGLRRLLADDDRAERIRVALERDADRGPMEEDSWAADSASGALGPRELAALRYARTLTLKPWEVAEASVAALRKTGLEDGEILEINQVVAYFAYANRTVLGLGATTEGDVLGLSPGDGGPGDWCHG